jgi:hypothetical protein
MHLYRNCEEVSEIEGTVYVTRLLSVLHCPIRQHLITHVCGQAQLFHIYGAWYFYNFIQTQDPIFPIKAKFSKCMTNNRHTLSILIGPSYRGFIHVHLPCRGTSKFYNGSMVDVDYPYIPYSDPPLRWSTCVPPYLNSKYSLQEKFWYATSNFRQVWPIFCRLWA